MVVSGLKIQQKTENSKHQLGISTEIIIVKKKISLMVTRLSNIFIIPLVLLFIFSGCSGTEERSLGYEIDSSELQSHINWLADPAMQGRLAGTRHEARAANYIADHFRDFGLEPGGVDDTYFQMFSLNGPMAQAMDMEGYLSRNVIGIIPGISEIDNYIVIGAHYDAQGMGGIISLNTDTEPKVHPGADDNASGTAGILELAHYFSENRPERTLVFIAFSGEELGLLGSRYFVSNSTLPDGEILAMVNLDMIGRMEDNELSIMGTGTASGWPEMIEEANTDSLNINQVSTGRGASDHTSFYEQNIPVLHYFTGTHPDYHTPGDTADKVNTEGTAKVVRHVKRVLIKLDGAEAGLLEFVDLGSRQPEQMQMDGVTLGVLPDYSYDGAGLRLESVRSGDIGDRAGLADGDIIIEIDGDPVNDIFDYMDLISMYDHGDTIEIRVLRDGEEIRIEVTF